MLGVEQTVVLPVAVEGNNSTDGVLGVDVEVSGFGKPQN